MRSLKEAGVPIALVPLAASSMSFHVMKIIYSLRPLIPARVGVALLRERLPVGLKQPSPLRIVSIRAKQQTPLDGELLF
jgi:hypothetical protein